MLRAEHGDADVSIGQRGRCRRESVRLVAEEQTDGKARLPIEKIHRVQTGFNGGDLMSGGMQTFDHVLRSPRMLPGNGFLRPESRLRYHVLRRMSRDARQPELLQRHRVRRAEKRAHVIEAANILEQHADWQGPNAVIRRGRRRGAVRDAIARYNKV